MSSICGRLGSCFPSFTWKNVDRALKVGIALQGCYMGGPLLAIAELGAYCYGKRVLKLDQEEGLQPLIPPAVVPSRLDISARLFHPAQSPTNITWSGNSCFCSSALWTSFTNELAFLGELPESIARRLNEKELFPGGAASLHVSADQTNTLFAIMDVVNKKGPITLADFNRLR